MILDPLHESDIRSIPSGWLGTEYFPSFATAGDGSKILVLRVGITGALFALGFGRNGITYSVIAAEIIRSHLKGKKHRYSEVFRLDRQQQLDANCKILSQNADDHLRERRANSRNYVRHGLCELPSMKYLLLSMPLLAALSISSCEKSEISTAGDVSFARSAFTALAKGDTKAQEMIDWPTFTAPGENVAAKYNDIPTETEKAQFRSEYVTGFATSFRQTGGSVDAFTNWTVSFHDSTRTEVTAQSPNGLLKLTVSERNSAEKLSAIDVVK